MRAAIDSRSDAARGGEIERVGVEHERHRRVEGAPQRVGGRVRLPEAGSGDDRRGAVERLCDLAQHQLRRHRIEQRMRRADEADAHLAGAGARRRARGEDRRADHAVRAADDGDRAERALVHVAPLAPQARGEHRGERRPVEPAAGRLAGVDVERMHADVAGEVGAVAGEEARLQRDERRGGVRVHDRAGRDAAVGVESGRQVEREHRRVERVRPRDQFGPGRVDRPPEADAEQRVDHQRGARAGNVRARAPARRRSTPRARRARRQAASTRRRGTRPRRRSSAPSARARRRSRRRRCCPAPRGPRPCRRAGRRASRRPARPPRRPAPSVRGCRAGARPRGRRRRRVSGRTRVDPSRDYGRTGVGGAP